MNREELFSIARARGWTPGAKITPAMRTGIVADIRRELTGPAMAQARVYDSDSSRPMTALEAVTALLEELNGQA